MEAVRDEIVEWALLVHVFQTNVDKVGALGFRRLYSLDLFKFAETSTLVKRLMLLLVDPGMRQNLDQFTALIRVFIQHPVDQVSNFEGSRRIFQGDSVNLSLENLSF